MAEEKEEVKFDVSRIDVTPNPAPLTSELHLEVDFSLDRSVGNAHWEIKVRLTCHASKGAMQSAKISLPVVFFPIFIYLF